jgi:hypothetical protein
LIIKNDKNDFNFQDIYLFTSNNTTELDNNLKLSLSEYYIMIKPLQVSTGPSKEQMMCELGV